MRSYVHDDLKTQKLFASIINRLSHGGSQSDIITGLLKDVCEHFHFGSGLVYEADHTGDFILQEQHSVYREKVQPPSRIRLDESLSAAEIKHLRDNDEVFVIQPREDEDYDNLHLSSLFSANSLIVCPVLAENGQLVALVAMLDRRGKILLTPDSVETAKTVLRLLSTHVRFRFLQKQIALAHSSLGSILDHLGIDVYVSDYQTREVLFVNKNMAETYGGREGIVGRKCYDILSGGNREACELCPHDRLVDENGSAAAACSWEYYRPQDNSWQKVYSAAFPWVDGRMAQVVTSVDISESKRNEAIINRQAFYDPLTQLPNRRKLYQDCDERLSEIEKAGGHAWILFFDLDNFKSVNDTLGHQAGDELLQKFGCFFDNDPEINGRFYRLGGDEFVLFLEDVSRKYVLNLVDRLLLRSGKPWKLTSGRPVCPTSIGIARFPEDGVGVEMLLNKADLALYKAKEAGKGRAFFTDGKFSRSIENLLKSQKACRARVNRKKAAAKNRPAAKERAGARARSKVLSQIKKSSTKAKQFTKCDNI